MEQRQVLAAAGAEWHMQKIEDALLLMHADAHVEDRRRWGKDTWKGKGKGKNKKRAVMLGRCRSERRAVDVQIAVKLVIGEEMQYVLWRCQTLAPKKRVVVLPLPQFTLWTPCMRPT